MTFCCFSVFFNSEILCGESRNHPALRVGRGEIDIDEIDATSILNCAGLRSLSRGEHAREHQQKCDDGGKAFHLCHMLSCAMLKLTNTLTGAAEPFTPHDGTTVRMYTCGPTVHDFAHIGNFRTYVFEDVLRRHLKSKWKLMHVMNITDIDDKIIRKVHGEGRRHSRVTRRPSPRHSSKTARSCASRGPTSSRRRPTTFRR